MEQCRRCGARSRKNLNREMPSFDRITSSFSFFVFWSGVQAALLSCLSPVEQGLEPRPSSTVDLADGLKFVPTVAEISIRRNLRDSRASFYAIGCLILRRTVAKVLSAFFGHPPSGERAEEPCACQHIARCQFRAGRTSRRGALVVRACGWLTTGQKRSSWRVLCSLGLGMTLPSTSVSFDGCRRRS
ncbi:hypothetical protein DFH06DRAFT_293043 [Mycena polygramma]|nr:hypothetical protein DFH06DRAFT_293043 [Mycena polygramma]